MTQDQKKEYLDQLERRLVNSGIPKRMQGGIIRWIVDGIRPGDFLSSIISNDLRMTFAYADVENKNIVHDYIVFFWNFAPKFCWGSEKALETWKGINNLDKELESKNG